MTEGIRDEGREEGGVQGREGRSDEGRDNR